MWESFERFSNFKLSWILISSMHKPTYLAVFSDDAEEILVHETVVEFDDGGMVQLERTDRAKKNGNYSS